MIGCYHLVRMKVREEIQTWGYTFKFQAENNEPKEMTKKEHLETGKKQNKAKQNPESMLQELGKELPRF